MLAGLLQDAASAYKATRHQQAKEIADKLRQITVPENWKTDGQKPNHRSLKTCLAASDCHSSAKRLEQVADHLSWVYSTGLRKRPAQFKGDYCFTAIIGPGSLIDNEEFRFGMYLQDPHTFYPSHQHAAVELYLPVSGTALWQKDDGPFEEVKPGTIIYHASYQPHATTTSETPMLAFWAWQGNLSMDTYSFVNR